MTLHVATFSVTVIAVIRDQCRFDSFHNPVYECTIAAHETFIFLIFWYFLSAKSFSRFQFLIKNVTHGYYSMLTDVLFRNISTQ